MTTHTIPPRKAEIKQQGDILQLVFSAEPDAIQSAINLQQPHQLVMKNLQYLMGILLFIPPPQKILLLGVGAGSLIQFYRHYLPQSHITAVDYDESILRLAQQKMLLPQASDRLQYEVQDARQFVQQTTQQYDLIVLDIFEGSQTPTWLINEQFSRRLQECLDRQGALAYNLLIQSGTAYQNFHHRLARIFRSQTLQLDIEDFENRLLYAFNFCPDRRSMMQNIEYGEQAELTYQLPFRQILSIIYNTNPVNSGVI